MSDTDKLRPLQVAGVRDYHCHPDYSIDAEGTVDAFCEAALERNLAEICFTTHYDANPRISGGVEYICVKGDKRPVTPESLRAYVDDVHRVAAEYYPRGLSVKLGVEIGWFPGCEELVEKLRDEFDFDHVLCGIHELDDICFCCQRSYQSCFGRYSAEQAVEKYFEQVWSAARSGLFDAMAHLNYYLRSGLDFYGDGIKTAHRPYLEETFRLLVAGETALEVNTSGIRHGLGDYYPLVEVVNAARKFGVDVSYLGSDAHRPEQIGFDFEAALSLVPDTIRGCEE